MGIRIVAPDMVWCPLQESRQVARALERALERWRYTPYESGQRFRGLGADCIGAVFGVVDEVDGRPRAAYPGLPHDAAMHSRSTAVAAMRELVRRYSPCVKVAPGPSGQTLVEPGDIVVTGMPGGGPGHVEMVGCRRNELWHALPEPGFHQGGWGLFAEQVLWAVYRIQDKRRWVNEVR